MEQHTFFGTWEISECSLNGHQPEPIGLEGIKFRLDEMGDITWFNDLINPMHNENLCECNNESANILYCCETYEIIDELSDGPGLLFGTFSGHSIEFKTDTFTPDKTMKLNCNGWYTLLCKRLQEEQSISQQAPFTLLSAFNEGYFNDGSIKSSEEIQFYLHSPILRLNGFDCSMNYQPNVKMAKTSSSVISSSSDTTSSSTGTTKAINKQQNQIKISIIAPSSPSATVITTTTTKTSQTTSSTNKLTSSSLNNKKSFKLLNNNSSSSSPSSTTENYKISSLLLSPNLLLSPSLEIFQLSSKIATNLSNSFNCLTNIKKSELFVDDQQQQQQNCNNINNNNNNNNNITNNNLITTSLISLNKKFPTTSSSDSDLQTSSSNNTNNCNNNKNIFNFNRPPLSPYRSKSPSFSLSIETPPSSPLTPISVLQTLPSVMLMPILQWIYSESLPSNLEEDICEKIIQFADSTAPLQKMIEPCKQYLRLIKLKKFVITIVIDAHNCLNKIINIINPTNVSHVPFNLCLIFKQIIREAAVGCAKLLQFCNVFVKDAFDISRGQRHEIIKYAKSRFPIFLVQFHQILKNILTILSNLNEEEKTELVVYLVPEIKTSLGLLTELINEIKSSLEKMCKHINSTTNNFKENTTANVTSTTITSTTSPTIVTTHRRIHNNRNLDIGNDYSNVSGGSAGGSGGGNCINNNGVMSDGNCTSNCYHHPTTNFDITSPTNFGNSQINLRFVLYMYEVKKLRDIYGRVTSALDIIQQKRIAFNEMNNTNKEETIRRNLKHLINEIPGYITIIEDLSNSLNDELGWKEFKFFFKLATSQINGVVLKLVDHRSALNDAVTYICQLVQKNQFTISLIDLGLLEPNNNLQNQCEPADDINLNYDFYSPKINLIQHLCEPPNAAQSSLSKNALRLLHSKHLTDMEFEIIGFPSDRTKLLTPDYDIKYQCYENNYNIHRFKAHRVIVAARCEWFRKALSCGMKESINRKIIIHDTSPVIFGRLLLYLYGAPIDNTVGAEQICELMLLADRYSVDELKAICEKTLKSLIDDSSVLCLLEIADRYNAGFLKANCLSYISQHIELINSDIFADLSMSLKNEVQDLIQWCGRIPEPWIDKPKNSSRHSLKSPSRISRSRRSSPSYM